MSSARRFQLLSQARSVCFSKGEQLYPASQPPAEVCMILSGTVCIFAEFAGEPEPVFLEELGAGDCAGWVPALSNVSGVRAVAKTEVQGLMVAAPAFLEIARYDPALREDMFSKVRKGEVWRAVLAEMERRTGGLFSAREIVGDLWKECVTRDWPEDEEQLGDKDRVWIVAGGEGVKHGDRWNGPDGVLWARLVGLPADKLNRALAGHSLPPSHAQAETVSPSRESLKQKPAEKATSLAKAALPPVTTTASKISVSTAENTPAPAADHERKGGSSLLRVVASVLSIGVIGAGLLALWASRQIVTEPISAAGILTFVGERRTVTAGVSGTIREWGMRPGARVERGSVIAIVQPPMDQAQAKALENAAGVARLQAEFCEGSLAGRALSPQGQPKHLAELAMELAKLRSDQRVLSAVERGALNDYTLTAAERQRVAELFANARAEQIDRISSANRDVGARSDDLREAEAELREAQDEERVQLDAVNALAAAKDKESRQDLVNARRALSVVRANVARKLEVVNRFKKEIASMRVQDAPLTHPADEATDSLPLVKASIAQLEEQMQRHAEALRKEAAGHEANLLRLKASAVPRQIETLQPGLILEAAPLAAGSVVTPDTVLGRLTTSQAWEVECRLTAEETSRLKPGQEVALVTTNPDGTTVRVTERLKFVNEAGGKPRLAIVNSLDSWHDGTHVKIEASIVTGTLLDSWIEELRWNLGFR